MKKFVCFSTIIFAISLNALAQEVAPNCTLDMDSTTSSDGMPNYVLDGVENARTLRDFRNAATNFYFYEGTGIAIRNLLVGIGPGFSQASVPLCNEIGQCVTSTITPLFGGSMSIGGLISFGNLIPVGYNVRVTDVGGNTESAETGFTYPQTVIPSSGPEGLIYQDQTCRLNNHLPQSTDSDDSSPSGSGGGGGTGGGGLGDDPNGPQPLVYGGATPMGGTGGTSGGNCWEYVARDQDGTFIGSYIICY